MAGKLIEFSYIVKDGILLKSPVAAFLQSDHIIVSGIKERRFFRQDNIVYPRPVMVKGLVIYYKGSEYISTTMSKEELLGTINDCGCAVLFQVFEDTFEDTFE